MDPRTPFLDAFRLHLRRRRLAVSLEGARRGGRRALAAALVLLLLTVLGVLPPVGEPATAALLFVAFLLAGVAAGASLELASRGGEAHLSRALDEVLGGTDLVATARALAARPGAPPRFGAAVLERAAAEVGSLPPDRVGALPRPPWRLLGIALLAAVLLAILPRGGLGLLPGLGVGWGRGGRAAPEGAHFGPAKDSPRGEPRTDPRSGEPGTEPHPDAAPGKPPEEEPPGKEPGAEPPAPVALLRLASLARSHPAAGPLTLGAVVDGGPGAGRGVELDLAFSVDGSPAEAVRRPFRIAAGDLEARTADLRALPGLLGALGPGKHRVRGELRDGEGRTVAASPEIEIVVEGPEEDGEGKGTPPPAPAPAPGEAPPPPQPRPPAEEPPPEGPRPGGAPPPPAPAPSLPPSAFQDRRIRPLFGEGEERVKRGPVLVLDPEGGHGEPAREAAPEEVLAEVRARAERAARREGVDPADAATVRRYFEALRRLVEGGK